MQEKYIQDDEIDLKELFKTIWDKKVFISIFTLLMTFASIIYVFVATPIYEAKALIEIGKYNRLDNMGGNLIDDATFLQKKLSTLFIDMENSIKDKTSKIS